MKGLLQRKLRHLWNIYQKSFLVILYQNGMETNVFSPFDQQSTVFKVKKQMKPWQDDYIINLFNFIGHQIKNKSSKNKFHYFILCWKCAPCSAIQSLARLTMLSVIFLTSSTDNEAANSLTFCFNSAGWNLTLISSMTEIM